VSTPNLQLARPKSHVFETFGSWALEGLCSAGRCWSLLAVDLLVDHLSRFPGRASATAKNPRDVARIYADLSTRISVRGSTPTPSPSAASSRIRRADERSGPALRAGSATGRSGTHKPGEKGSGLVHAGSSCLRDAGRLRPACPTAAPIRDDPRLVMSWHARVRRQRRPAPLRRLMMIRASTRYPDTLGVGSWQLALA
jgi:hypothetical protein